MLLTESEFINFYEGCNYWPVNRALRPRQLHIPRTLSDFFKDATIDELDLLLKKTNNTLELSLNDDGLRRLAPILLHEALFHFYKAFYNYLAARSLYFGGMLAWMDITYYYAKFYLANSMTTLAGATSYWISKEKINTLSSENLLFLKKIAEKLASKKGYRIQLNIESQNRQGKIIFDKKSVRSHQDVWNSYRKLPFDALGVTNLLMKMSGQPEDFGAEFIINERNELNYSFEGYEQVDFNLRPKGFEQFFERDYTKQLLANRIYDYDGGSVLLAFSTQLSLFRKLEVKKLPIEKEKFAFMIDYCLPDSIAKQSLLKLCEEYFPTRELHYSTDGEKFYDERDRAL